MTRILPVLTLSLALAATAALPASADPAAWSELRAGDMRKLVFHDRPQAVTDRPFVTVDGAEETLDQYRGQVVVLNFWATWCAPCRKEMPALDALNMDLGGPDFRVVTIATGRNAPPAMRRFFEETGIQTLPLHNDPKQAIARDMAVFGLPITVILNRDGQEIARLRGDADWAGEDAKTILRAIIEAGV